jgi:Lon protease-like protein
VTQDDPIGELWQAPISALNNRRAALNYRIMQIPRETPVMTLPNATLFPQALLPLYIFEPRYRRMLADALDSNRLIAVAMQKPGATRETPASVAGLGLIRVSVRHRDGTSHLVLQGIGRIGLEETVRYKPYRIQRFRSLKAPQCDGVAADALLTRMRELLKERIELGLPLPFPGVPAPPDFPQKKMLEYLDSITDPEQAADLVSSAVLPEAAQRQTLLETVDVETRLRRLIQFLLAEIRKQRKSNDHE